MESLHYPLLSVREGGKGGREGGKEGKEGREGGKKKER